MKHPDYDIPSILDYMNKFALLQSAATALISAGVLEVGIKDFWVGIALIVVGVGAYIIYEKLPDDK